MPLRALGCTDASLQGNTYILDVHHFGTDPKTYSTQALQRNTIRCSGFRVSGYWLVCTHSLSQRSKSSSFETICKMTRHTIGCRVWGFWIRQMHNKLGASHVQHLALWLVIFNGRCFHFSRNKTTINVYSIVSVVQARLGHL